MLSRNEIKEIAKLQQKKYRISEKKILVEGPRLVLEALRSDWQIEKIIMTPAFRDRPLAQVLIGKAKERKSPLYEVPRTEFNRMSDTIHSQGILGVVKMKQWEYQPLDMLVQTPKCLFVTIEKLQDPGNLGTIIRTAEWLGANAVILGPDCVEWSNPKTLRATMGAIFHLPVFELEQFVEFLQEAKKFGAFIYAADLRGDFPYTTLRYSTKKLLLLGDEVQGISERCITLADYKVVIPRRGRIESLNVSIAAAILMAEMTKN